MRVNVVGPDDEAWASRLTRVSHDVHHLPGYHRFERRQGGGEPYLAVVDDGDRGLLWPYLLSPIPGEIGDGEDEYDVTSAYGYPGPLAWGEVDPAFLGSTWDLVRGVWRDQGAVAAFTRFNPVLGNHVLAQGFRGDDPEQPDGVRILGVTVSVSCSLDDEAAWRQYYPKLRQHLRRAAREGVTTEEDTAWAAVDDFARVYGESMGRNAARAEYRFDADDFAELRDELDGHAYLLLTRRAGEVVAGGLFTECGGIVQAHLIGTANAYLSLSPAKSLMDFARSWARQHGWRTLHIGGGRGGREDSLFRFKREFSPTRHDFAVGRWVLDADAYRRLSKARYGGAPEASPGEYFPAYRAPVAADQASDTDTAAG